MVLLESPQGAATLKARITIPVAPGVVMATHGWGQPYAGGPMINDVTAEQPRDAISGATGNRSFLCEIRKIEREVAHGSTNWPLRQPRSLFRLFHL